MSLEKVVVGTSGEQSPKVAYLKTRLLVKEFELYPEEWWKPKDDFGQRNGGEGRRTSSL